MSERDDLEPTTEDWLDLLACIDIAFTALAGAALSALTIYFLIVELVAYLPK